jgi:hypothetical protein
VFFHGWAHAEITHHKNDIPCKDGIPDGSTLRDKEILSQNCQKVYEGHEKLKRKCAMSGHLDSGFRTKDLMLIYYQLLENTRKAI